VTIADRLKTLQRQAGRASVPATTATSSELRTQLRRLLGTRERIARRAALAAPAGNEIGPGLHLVEQTLPANVSSTLALPWDDPTPVERSRLVCFDTETTGLAGGVGTKAFMIGVAQWRCDRIVTRQLYLTALAGEQQMLATFASWLPHDAIFISYNGRSYDAPLLKGRYRMHRQLHPFEQRRHVDLLYPVRRAYRGVWANCRLQTIERELLGIVREDDLPGAEAPAAWLSFLRGHSNRNLGRVVEHNRQDVLTLAVLLDRLVDRMTPTSPARSMTEADQVAI
jgi:uncharacterized protein YprB with RNaseH-like and TPR domain